MPTTVTVATERVSVDLILWRMHRRPVPGLLEATLEANPGLADLGPELPVGTVLAVPDMDTPDAATVVPLWG